MDKNRHKYRAWTGAEMIYFNIFSVPKLSKDAVIMQCTGIFDKNEKLIYEKDIVRIQHGYGSSRKPKSLPEYVYTLEIVEWSDQPEFPLNNHNNHSYCNSKGFTVWGEQHGKWTADIGSGKKLHDDYWKIVGSKDVGNDWYRCFFPWDTSEVVGNIFENLDIVGEYVPFVVPTKEEIYFEK